MQLVLGLVYTRDIREGAATPEPDENIEVFRLPLSKALALVTASKIHDGKTLIGLMLYDARRRRNDAGC